MRRLLAVILTLSLIACSSDSDSYTIDGVANGFEDNTSLYIYTLENNQAKVVDTLTVTNGKFKAKFPKSETSNIHYFHLADLKANVLFFPENENLKATFYKDSIQSSFVSGSPQNDAYTNYARKMRSFNAQKQEHSQRFQEARAQNDMTTLAQIQTENREIAADEVAFKKEFVNSNINSIFSVMLLSELVSRKEITGTEATEIIGKFSPKINASSIAIDLKKSLAEIKQTDVGGMAPGFSAPSPDGTEISLQDAMGKYTIIDFWASWCRPCRAENPNVVRVYNKYHDKGLNIISVSLDKAGQKDRWIQAIKDDKMDWHHVSNLQSWQEPIAKMYGVRSIPATFLLNEKGEIIDKNLRGAALENKIASLLGQ